jgi:hypothetical protein
MIFLSKKTVDHDHEDETECYTDNCQILILYVITLNTSDQVLKYNITSVIIYETKLNIYYMK